MTTFYDLLQTHNKMRQSGYTPGHWEVSKALYDEMLEWVELRPSGDLEHEHQLFTPLMYIESLFGTPLEIRESMGAGDVRLIAVPPEDIMTPEYHAICVRSIQESATQRLNEFVQRQREDFENFSTELVQHVARLVAELPPIGSTMASNKDTEGK